MESGWAGVWQLPKVNLPQSCTDLEVRDEILFIYSLCISRDEGSCKLQQYKKKKREKSKVQLPTDARIARKAPYVKKQSNVILLDLFPNLDPLHIFLIPAFFPGLSPPRV